MKKIISIALTFVLLMSTFVVGTVSVSAEQRPIYDYNENCTVFYEYDIVTKTLTISGQGEYITDQGDYAFSGEGGCKFDAFYTFDDYRNKVEKVVFEEGIVNVGGASFVKFSKLNTIVLPETITRIEAYAFSDCTALEEIVLPTSLKKIGFEAFAGCRNLKALHIPKGVEEIADNFIFDTPNLSGLTVDTENEHFVAVDNVLYNKEMTKIFAVAPKQETVEIPATVKEIAQLSFALSNVKTIKVPSSVETLGAGAFFKSALQEITFEGESKVKEILTTNSQYGDEAEEYYGTFEDCVNLKKLVIPNSVKTVGNRALGGCSSLEYLYVGKAVENWGYDNFYGSAKLTKIKVHKDNKDFFTYKGGFYGKRRERNVLLYFFGSRKNVKIKKGTQGIDSFAFKDTKAQNVTVPKTVTSMGSAVFYNAQNLKSVKFAKKIQLKYLGWDYVSYYYGWCRYSKPKFQNMAMFYNCKKLKSVSFPESLVATEGVVFENCKKLKTVHFGKNFNYNGGNTYYDDYFTYFAKKCPNLESITFSKDNKKFMSEDSGIYSKNKVEMYYYAKAAKAKTFVIPKGVRHIHGGVFKNCKYLKRVKFVYDYENKKDCWFSSDTFGKNVTVLIKKNSWAHREVKRMKENFRVKVKHKFY